MSFFISDSSFFYSYYIFFHAVKQPCNYYSKLYYLINCLSLFHFALPRENSLVLSFMACFSLWLPVWQPGFYVLGRFSRTPILGRVVLYCSCSVGPSGTISLITKCGCSNNVSCMCCVGPPVIMKSWLLLACSFVGLTPRLADSKVQPPTQCAGCYVGASHMKWNLPQQCLEPANISLCIYYFCSVLGPALLSKSGHWVYWF